MLPAADESKLSTAVGDCVSRVISQRIGFDSNLEPAGKVDG